MLSAHFYQWMFFICSFVRLLIVHLKANTHALITKFGHIALESDKVALFLREVQNIFILDKVAQKWTLFILQYSEVPSA